MAIIQAGMVRNGKKDIWKNIRRYVIILDDSRAVVERKTGEIQL